MTNREKDLLDSLKLIKSVHKHGNASMAGSVHSLINWIRWYEEYTGTKEISRKFSKLFTAGEILDYIGRLVYNTEYTPEEKESKLKAACGEIKSDAEWYMFINDTVFVPLGYYDLLGVILDIEKLIEQPEFRKTIKLKEKVE